MSFTPDGFIARTLLSVLATAGAFYICVMPLLIDGLSASVGLSTRDAGFVGAANMYGGACGSIILAVFARHVRWRALANRLLPALICADALSTFVQEIWPLAALRFVQGGLGGMLVGATFLVVGRMSVPSRTFGLTILLQVALGAGLIATVPALVRDHGMFVVFGGMCAFSAIAWLALQFLPRQGPEEIGAAAHLGQLRIGSRATVVALSAVGLFQAGNMALYAYEVGLGQSLGHSLSFVSWSLGLCGITEVLGPLLVVTMPAGVLNRVALVASLAAALAGAALLFFGGVPEIWLAAIFIWRIAWSFGLPLLFGLCASLDQSGAGAAWAAVASKVGMGTGPLLAAMVLGNDRFVAQTGVAVALLAGALLAGIIASLPKPTRAPLAAPVGGHSN